MFDYDDDDVYISVYFTYHQCDTLSLVLNLDHAEQNIVWLNIFQFKVKSGCDNISKVLSGLRAQVSLNK